MKIEGKTIPAPQNIKRREAFLLIHADKIPTTYLQAQLLKIAMIRTQKKLRWETTTKLATQEERMKDIKNVIPVPQKKSLVARIKGMFKSQRGQ